MGINVNLMFNGNCRQAIEFYARIFGAAPSHIMTFGETLHSLDYTLPEEVGDLVMHARMNILGTEVMFSDNFPGSSFTIGNNVTISVVTGDEGRIQKTFNALKEGGNVQMELQQTFWSKYYGCLRDKFGVEWKFNYEKTHS